ncbi:MAG: nickel pincer cofactor biosynthesis protein LarC [Syntrophobacter sp.]
MNIAYFDCFSGISGDMTLGALVDLGVPVETLVSELRKLPLTDWSLETTRERRGAIEGVRVAITAGEQPHRHLSDIRNIIGDSGLDAWVKENGLAIFERIARAEGRVHGISPSEVHFHEVGAVDSILDIVGALFGLRYLNIEQVHCSPIPVGRGFVRTQHGSLPLPAPATAELLSGVPIQGTHIERELVTPTGAAIASTLACSFGPVPPMTLLATGYGAGTNRADNPPNLLRILSGKAVPSAISRDLLIVETNIDDMNPEIYNYVIDKLFALGALDVSLTSMQMKKNRPAVLLRVLIEPALEAAAAELILGETTTLGVRVYPVKRIELPRETPIISTVFGPVRVKRVQLPNGGERIIPEYEECGRIAKEKGIPLPDVYQRILAGPE